MKLQLSERDKKLLLILSIVVIICVPYFLIVSPTLEKVEITEGEIKVLKDTKNRYEQWALNANNYIEDSESLMIKKEMLINKFPSELSHEGMIIFTYETERAIPIKLSQMSLGEDVAAQITSEATAEAITEIEKAIGDVTSTEVIQDTTETHAISADLIATASQTQYAFSAGYSEFKNFLEYIKSYKDRMVITSLTATYSAEQELVSGSITLMQYALSGTGSKPTSFIEPTMRQGSTNVFRQAAGNYVEEDTKDSPDFFLMLTQPEADVEAKIFGKSEDASEESYFTSDQNSEQELTITFEGEGGEYTAHYKIGKESYVEEGVSFRKSGYINFEVISSPRVGGNDKVAAKLNVVNRTDTTVTVSVLNDDTENPRVNIIGKTGTILMK